jgi:hypothetical protein
MKSAITEARIRLEVCSTVRPLFRVRSDVEVGAADPLWRAIRGQNVEGKKIKEANQCKRSWVRFWWRF